MPCAPSPSAIACTSRGCIPQKSAIWVKVSAVFSISHTAVALGISGSVMSWSSLGRLLARRGCARRERGRTRDMPIVRGWVKGAAGIMMQLHSDGRRNMREEDEEPVRKRTRLEKPVLDTFGIVELREYIAELKEEIARVEADIERKQGHRSAADGFF